MSRKAENQRRYRERKKSGLRVLRVAFDDELIAQAVRYGLIDIDATENDPDLEEALEEVFRRFIEGVAGDIERQTPFCVTGNEPSPEHARIRNERKTEVLR